MLVSNPAGFAANVVLAVLANSKIIHSARGDFCRIIPITFSLGDKSGIWHFRKRLSRVKG